MEPPKVGGPRATLIVCPLSVLSNWELQIADHTDGSLRVARYHGPSGCPSVPGLQGTLLSTHTSRHSPFL